MPEKDKTSRSPENSPEVREYLCECLRVWDIPTDAGKRDRVQYMLGYLEQGGYNLAAALVGILKGTYGDRAKELYLNYQNLVGEELGRKDRQFYDKHKDLIY